MVTFYVSLFPSGWRYISKKAGGGPLFYILPSLPNLKFPVFKIKRRKVFLGADKLNLLNVARNSLNIFSSPPSLSFHVVGFLELAAMKTRVLHNSSDLEEVGRCSVSRDISCNLIYMII